MSSHNPYQPPTSLDDGQLRPQADLGGVPEPIREAMRQTKPWVTFLAILGFIGTGLIAIAGLGVVAGAGAIANVPSYLGLIYVLLAVLYFFPSLILFKYGSAIKRMLSGKGMDGLSDALWQQKSFWRLIGIMTIVLLGLYMIAIVAIGVGVASRSHL